MAWLDAVVKLVTGLAWPAVVLAAVLILRRELASLFGRLTRVIAPGVEAEFASEVVAAGEIAEAAVPNPPDEIRLAATPGDPLSAPRNHTLDDSIAEADRHPVGAVVRAWDLVEYFAKQTAEQDELRYTARAIVRRLARRGAISDDLVGVADKLFRLRSQIVNGYVIPDGKAAREFVTAAWRLATALQNAHTTASIDGETTHPAE